MGFQEKCNPSKDLNSLPLEELFGSLIAHEMSMKEDEEMEGKKNKKKDLEIALKTSSKYIESSSEGDDEGADSDDVKHLTKRFYKFLNRESKTRKASKRKSKLITKNVMNWVMSNQVALI